MRKVQVGLGLLATLWADVAVAGEVLKPKEVAADVHEIVGLHRRGIVALASEDAERREVLDVAGDMAFHERQAALSELHEGLRAEIEAAGACGFCRPLKGVSTFLDTVEADKRLHDGDKLAFQETMSLLVEALADTPGEGERRETLRARLVEDQLAIDAIAQKMREEAKGLLGRTRGMVIQREKWDAYVRFVRSVYSEERVLMEYSPTPAGEGTRGRAKQDGDVVYGFGVPKGTFVLTFDDGPSATNTPKILDILAQNDSRGVFFALGKNARGNEGLIGRILADGHLLGNHTLSHKNLPKLADDEIVRQIDQGRLELEGSAGRPVVLFRPPYGATDGRVMDALQHRSMRSYLWNVDSRDWADPIPESIAATVLEQVDQQKRGVILFHDVHSQTVEALPLVMAGLKERGLVTELYDGQQVVGEQVAIQEPAASAPASAAEVSHYNDSHAVIIGINDYEYWPKLQYAQTDAEGIREALIHQFGFQEKNVITLFDREATRARILEVLGDILPQQVYKDDRVFVFFAGHGATRVLPDGSERGYIIPADADLERLQSTAISMSLLQDVQEGLPAKHVFFVMDACYSGLALTRGSSVGVLDSRRYLAEITRRPARQILTAGGAEEQVADYGPGNHSIFTWNVLQGLGGQADLNGDGVITASELGGYVAPRVSDTSHQTPAFGNLVGSSGGEFVFELASGPQLLSAVSPEDDVSKLAAEKEELERQLAELRAQLSSTGEVRGTPTEDPKVEAERYHSIGLGFFRRGEYESALAAFQQAVRLQPNDVRAVNNLGFTYYQVGRYQEASDEVRRALTLDPTRAVAWLNLGDALDKLGDGPGAAEAWTKYLTMIPESPERPRLETAMGVVPVGSE